MRQTREPPWGNSLINTLRNVAASCGAEAQSVWWMATAYLTVPSQCKALPPSARGPGRGGEALVEGARRFISGIKNPQTRFSSKYFRSKGREEILILPHLSNAVVYSKPLILCVSIVRLGGRVIDRGSRQ